MFHRHLFPRCLSLLLGFSLILSACNGDSGDDGSAAASGSATQVLDTALVLAESGLTLREEPRQEAAKVAVVPQLAEVEVLDKSGPAEEIEGMKAFWYKVATREGETGWCFSGFLGISGGKPHCTCPADKAFISHYEDVAEGNPLRLTRGITYRGEAELPCYIDGANLGMDHTSMGYKISGAGRWIAVDNGTDIFGSLVIMDLQSGEVHTSITYDRSLNDWKGENLFFWTTDHQPVDPPEGNLHPTWVLVEEMQFKDGELLKTGAMEKMPSH